MKNILTFILFMCYSVISSQNIKIDYKITLNRNSTITSGVSFYYLLLKNNESVYYNKPEDDVKGLKHKDDAFDKKVKQDGSIELKLGDKHSITITKDIFYKNYLKDTLIFNDFLPPSKKVIVGESLNLFKWKIIPKQDTTILTYKCQKATCNFRGRKYVAYFSKDLYQMGGPWKFDGLPGLILYIYSEDNYFIIEPQKIALNQSQNDIKNPYTKDKIITWQEYAKIFEEKLKKIAKLMKSKFKEFDKLSVKITDKIEDLQIEEIKLKIKE